MKTKLIFPPKIQIQTVFVLLFFFIFNLTQNYSQSQNLVFCGNGSGNASQGQGPISDGFGNHFTFAELTVPQPNGQPLNSNVAAFCHCDDVGFGTAPFKLWYEDCFLNTGTGFDDPILGASRRSVLCQVFSELAQSIIPNPNVCDGSIPTINIRIQPSQTPSMPPLAINVGGTGGPYFYNEQVGIADGLPWIILNSGSIPSGFAQTYHGTMRVNFNPASNFIWHLDTNTNPPPDQHDLYTVCLHEAIHVLGFLSFLSDAGISISNPFGNGSGGYTRYDSFLKMINDDNGSIPNNTPVIVNNPSPSLSWNFNSPLITTDELHRSCLDPSITGPDMIFAGNSKYPIFTAAQTSNSSFSHLNINCDNSITPEYTMNPSLPKGVRRPLTNAERDILCTLGYRLNNSGISDCNCAVGGSDDFGSGCGGNEYIVSICQTLQIDIADLLENDPNAVDIEFLQLINPSIGSLTQTSPGVYLFDPAQTGLAILIYVPIGCNGKTGNKTYVYIRVINGENCITSCNDEMLTCADPMGFDNCGSSTVCDQISPCNVACNPSICGTIMSDQELNNLVGFNMFASFHIVDVPGWIPTHGSPDFDLFASNTNGSGSINIFGGFYQNNVFTEGVMTFVQINSNINYLVSLYTGLTNGKVGSNILHIDLVEGDNLVLTGDQSGLSLPVYTGAPIIPVFSESIGVTNGLNYRIGRCLSVGSSLYNALWFYMDPMGGTYQGAHIDDLEIVPDNFTAGQDQIIIGCGTPVTLGEDFCMLDNVGVEYTWIDQTTNQVIANYQILNGLVVNFSGSFDPISFQATVTPLQTTTYLLRRTVFDYGGLPQDFEFCNDFDAVTITISTSPPNASFSITHLSCSSFEFVPSGGSGQIHLWDFGDGITSTLNNPVHQFLVGTFVITHTITNECGVSMTSSQTVVIDCDLSSFECPCLGVNTLNINAGVPSTNPTDPNTTPVSILNTEIPSHTVSNTLFPHTLWNTCLAVKGNLIIDQDYDLTIVGGEIKMQPGARIIVAPGATLRLGFINGGTGLEQGVHGCASMWRSIEVQPGGSLWVGGNVIQDGEFAFDIKSDPAVTSTFSCVGNQFNRNHVGVRVNNPAFSVVNQGLGFSDNHFFASGGALLSKFSTDVVNWNSLYPYCGLYLKNSSFLAGNKVDPASGNEFYNMRNGIIAEGSSLFAHFLNVHNIQGGAPGIPNPSFLTSTGIGIHAKNCNDIFIRKSTFNSVSTGIHTFRSSVDLQSSILQNVDMGLNINTPSFRTVNIYDNDIFFRNIGVHAWDVGTALQVHIAGNDPIEFIPNNQLSNRTGIQIAGMTPSVQLFDAKIAGNHINLNSGTLGSRGIDIGFTGNWKVLENFINYNGTNNISNPASFFPGIGMTTADNSIVYHNTIIGNNVGAQIRGISLSASKKCKLCCNITDGFHTGFTFAAVNAGTNFRHSDIGNHNIGLEIQYGYIEEQKLAGNKWNGVYGVNSALHLGGLSDIQGSDFLVELPLGTTLWPINPSSPAAPNQWFIQWPGYSTYCGNDNFNCLESSPYPLPPDGFPRDFTGSEIRTASYGFEHTLYGAMLQFESSRSLYKDLKENIALLGVDNSVDHFYSEEANSPIGLIYEIDKQIADMWSVSSSSRTSINNFKNTIDSLVFGINRIDSLFLFATTFSDTLILKNQKQVLTEALKQPIVGLQNILNGLNSIQQSMISSILTLNQSLPSEAILVANRKTVNQIYLESVASDIFLLNTNQQNALLAVALQCPKEGGEAVLQARAMYSQLVENIIFDDEVLCNGAARGSSNERSSSPMIKPNFKVSLVPNPSNDRFALFMSSLPIGTSLILKVCDANGKMVKELSIFNGEVVLHSFSPGFYFCHIYVNDEIADVVKLIIIH